MKVASISSSFSQGIDDVNNPRSRTAGVCFVLFFFGGGGGLVFLFDVVKYLSCSSAVKVWKKSSDQTVIMSLIKKKLSSKQIQMLDKIRNIVLIQISPDMWGGTQAQGYLCI